MLNKSLKNEIEGLISQVKDDELFQDCAKEIIHPEYVYKNDYSNEWRVYSLIPYSTIEDNVSEVLEMLNRYKNDPRSIFVISMLCSKEVKRLSYLSLAEMFRSYYALEDHNKSLNKLNSKLKKSKYNFSINRINKKINKKKVLIESYEKMIQANYDCFWCLNDFANKIYEANSRAYSKAQRDGYMRWHF